MLTLFVMEIFYRKQEMGREKMFHLLLYIIMQKSEEKTFIRNIRH
jgi:hypothetical protein